MNERRPPDELDHHDLGAHSHHSFRLYGDEEVWVSDIRGRGGASDPDVSVRYKNVELSGRLSTLLSFSELVSALLTEVLVRRDEIEHYDEEPSTRRRPIEGPRGRVAKRPTSD